MRRLRVGRAAALAVLVLGVGAIGAAGPAAAAPEAPAASAAERTTADRVREAVEAFLAERAPGARNIVQIPALHDFELPDVAPDAVEVRLSAHPHQSWVGSVPVTAVLVADGTERKRGVITAHVSALVPVLVAERPLPKGALLGPGDVAVEERDVSGLPGDALGHPGQALGLQAARSIRAGTVLRARFVEARVVVARGQQVELRYRRGPLEIVGHGKARQDGRPGEWIRVQNADSGREVSGRVDEDGVVHVVF